MPINLASCILKDFMYQQDKKMHYIFENDKLVLVNRDEVADSILRNIDAVFDKFIGSDLPIERTYDPFALNQAMCRYSRDVFGESRLHARIMHFGNKYNIQENDLEEIASYEDYGLKINSQSPYIHRRIACIFYWFSVLKPFSAVIKSPTISNSTYDFLECHNEYTTYILVLMTLACLNLTINIHEHLPSFKQFMYDLHFRKISRSSLEFFLINHISPLS